MKVTKPAITVFDPDFYLDPFDVEEGKECRACRGDGYDDDDAPCIACGGEGYL